MAMRRMLRTVILIVFLGAASMLPAQGPPTKTTEVMVLLSAKPGIPREEFRKVMPEEVRATLQLYLDGKVRQWYSRSDGKGVVFILNCLSVGEAQTIAESLPLAKAKLVSYEYTELGPLAPLSNLLGSGSAK
jgi:hypothetical protein